MGDYDWGTPAAASGGPDKQDRKVGGLAVGIIVAAVAAAVLVVGAIVVGVSVWNTGGNSESSASDGQGAPQFTAVTEETSSESEQVTSSVPSSVTSTSTSAESSSPASPSTSSESSEPGADGPPGNLDSGGWRGVSDATCNADDEWEFAATNGEDYAVVCRVGERGGLYYRGFYNDRGAEYDIDESDSSAGRWVTGTLDRNGSRVEIQSGGIRVIDADGDTVSSRSFTWNSEDDSR